MKTSSVQGINHAGAVIRIAGVVVASLILFAGGSGCATRQVSGHEPEDRAVLVTARVGDTVQMSWQSRTDRRYTILYAEGTYTYTEGEIWKPLPNFQDIPGTGGEMVAVDRVSTGRPRTYRLQSRPR